MKRIELNKHFQDFTNELNVILEKLNETYFMINENYGKKEADLLLEGFWDKVKSGVNKVNKAAHSAGKFVGKGVKTVTDLGERAKKLINDLANKVSKYVNIAFQYIVSAPGKFMEKMSNMWTDLKNNLSQLKNEAGEKFNEAVSSVTNAIITKIVEPLKAKWSEFKQNIANHKEELKGKIDEMKQMGKELANSGKENLVALGKAILKGVETAGVIVLAIIFLPFYAAFKGGEALYNVGDKIITSIKENAPEIWKELNLSGEFKSGFEEGKAKPTTESRILDFGNFIKKL